MIRLTSHGGFLYYRLSHVHHPVIIGWHNYTGFFDIQRSWVLHQGVHRGTTAALALLNDQGKKGGVMTGSFVGGLSGAFLPVSEEQGMIDGVNRGVRRASRVFTDS